MSSPSKTMRPPVGRRRPVRQLKKVLLPAPFGPMRARTSPRRTSRVTPLRAVRPPKRIVRPSVRSRTPSGGDAERPVLTRTLRERAGRRQHGLLPRGPREDAVPAVVDAEDELVDEGLVVLLAELLVALREVVPGPDLHALQRLDELRGVLAAAKARPLHPE